jgi:hypothetical protein
VRPQAENEAIAIASSIRTDSRTRLDRERILLTAFPRRPGRALEISIVPPLWHSYGAGEAEPIGMGDQRQYNPDEAG